MAKFPIQQAPERLGVTPTTAVRAGLDVSAAIPPDVIPIGEAEIGQAVVGIGGTLMDLGAKWDLINAKTQLGESSIAASDAINKYFLELEGNDNPETYGENLNRLFEELTMLAPANRTAAGIYNKKLAAQQLTIGKQTRDMARKKIKSKAQATDFLLLQTGDFVTYKASIINGVKLGVYTATEGQKLLDDADKERDKKEKDDTLGMALTKRDKEGVLIVDEANEIVNGSDILNVNEKIDLLNQITNRFNQEKNQRDIQFRNRMGEEAERLGKLLVDGELIEQEMDEIDLGGVGEQKSQEETFKRKWKKIYQDSLKTRTTDPKIRNDLLSGTYEISSGAKTKQQVQDEITEQIKNLDDKDFSMLWSRTEQEFKSWRAAQMTKTVREIRSQIVTIDESTMEKMIGILRGEALEEVQTRRQAEEDKYAEAVFELEAWLEEHPEPTRDDFYKEKRRILRDYRNKTAEQIRQGRAEFKEIQTTQPTEEQLKSQAAATDDVNERKRIYEQGRELGYWK